MTTHVEELQVAFKDKQTHAFEEMAKAQAEGNAATRMEEIKALQADADAAHNEYLSAREFEQLQAKAETNIRWMGERSNSPPLTGGENLRPQSDKRSLGRKFVESNEFKSWYATMAPQGKISDSMRGLQSPPFSIGSVFNPQAALLTGGSATSAGALFMNDEYSGITELGRRPLTIRDIVTNGTTDSDTVEFVRVTTETNNAAPVAEATAAGDGTGVKPESVLAFERVTTPVKTIAHWIPATKAALSDAGQLRTLIDAFLRYGLEEELEDQIVNGDGAGQNFTGIFATTGTQTQAWSTDILETTRKAKTLCYTVGRVVPNAYALSPASWETIDLLQDNEAKYYAGGPFNVMTPRLWGLPVVISEALPTGYALVGDFKKAVLWDREQASIQVSDSHSDFFIRNLVAILAEMRAAFGVLKPNAFVEIDVVA